MSKLLADFGINPLLFEKKKTNFALEECENGLHLGNSNKFDCSRFAPSLQRKGDIGQLSTKKIQTNKESEVIMPEFDLFTGREERMKAVAKKAAASKESAIKFLIEAGILEPSGELAPHLR